ncbi:hypothetical protein [Stagnihabitans tardus]|uniref:DUF4350 domain-containing protein n=1 Tax=Stagnihabitans tardus TaxID=2699202 RepID=A0AAE5BRI9_9RHOB|nr:hypothetical protein [Stagnihabitans tardus]NBZ86615.1 hypothetical protein [Stagnihabitans tardus]
MGKWVAGLAIALLIGLGFWWLGVSTRQELRGLDASVIGTDGLVKVLTDQGLKVEVAAPGTAIKVGDIGLRILPLYDMDLFDDRPETVGDVTQRNISAWAVRSKRLQATTLIVLPKWRWAAVQEGVAAPETAIPLEAYRPLFEQLAINGVKIGRNPASFAEARAYGHAGAAFMEQSFDATDLPDRCSAYWRRGNWAQVISCRGEDDEVFYVLADPDLLNNHGLTLADNAGVGAGLLRGLLVAPSDLVYLDRFEADFTTYDGGDERVDYERTPDDLWRFFKPPLGEIWAMLAILLALFLWRGSRRFGPVRAPQDETPERSRREAIATRARLIRLTGQDGAMVADYVKSDLTRMAETAFGAGRGEVARLFPLLARRNPARAAEFQGLAQELMRATPQPAAALRRQLDTYHQLQRILTHGDDA